MNNTNTGRFSCVCGAVAVAAAALAAVCRPSFIIYVIINSTLLLTMSLADWHFLCALISALLRYRKALIFS